MLISEFLSTSNFSNECNVKVFKNNEEITSGNISTGCVVKIIKDGIELQTYTIVIYGDTSGDGNIASIDALAVVKNRLNLENFKSEAYEEAGKVTSGTRTKNLQPSAIDALAIVKHKLELEQISQL